MKSVDVPFFSLVITTKDRPGDLEVLLESLQRQVNAPSYEVIIVDDASTLPYSHLKKGELCWIENQTSLGPSYNRNIAALKANGTYLLFLDDDTILRESNLSTLKSILISHPELGALGGCGPLSTQNRDEVDYISVKTLRYWKNHKQIIRNEEGQRKDLFYGDHIESAYMAVPRDLFFKCGGFDPYWFYMGEDRDLCLAIRKLGYKVAASWSARAIHLNHTSYGTDEIKQRRALRFNRIIEVSLKRKGQLYTKFQIYRERKLLSQYLTKREIAEKFATARELSKRQRIDFTTSDALELYRKSYLEKEVVKEHPQNIVLFLNNRCNAQCEHCFIPDLNNHSPELNCQEWLQVLQGIDTSFSLTITGGEPLLTVGLGEFLNDIFEHTQCNYIGLLTNGSFPEKIASIAKSLTEKFPNKKLKIQISLDGTKDIHNKIRKNKNSFDQALRTGALLKEIDAKKFEFVYLATLTKNNRDDLMVLIDELARDQFKSKFTLVRGNSFSTFEVPLSLLRNGYEPQVESLSLSPSEIRSFVAEIEAKYPDYFYKNQKEKIQRQTNTLESKKRLYHCSAGISEVVLYSDGHVAVCEQTKSVGNLKDFGLSFDAIWNSEGIKAARASTKKCACIHGCNISTGIRK